MEPGLVDRVFQFVKSARWRIGEQSALEALGKVHEQTGAGGPVEWHKMGAGWSWSRKVGTDDDHATAARGLAGDQARRLAAQVHQLYVLDEFTYPINWGWVDVEDVATTLNSRPGYQHVIITGRNAEPRLLQVASLVTEMTKIKHPFDPVRRASGASNGDRPAARRDRSADLGHGKTTVATGLMAAGGAGLEVMGRSR